MYRNKVWLVFLGLILSATLWYTIDTALDFYHMWKLSEPHTPQIEKWAFHESQDEEFYPEVSYSFERKGEIIHKTEVLKSDKAINPWILQEKFPEIAHREWVVYCNPKIPKECTLQKEYPLKRGVYTLILLAISLYFVFLGRYLYRVTRV